MSKFSRIEDLSSRTVSKAKREGWRSLKSARHRLAGNDSQQRLLIFGCQRSGTSMVTRVFEADSRSKVFYEFSPLSKGCAEDLVWRPLAEVDTMMTASRAPFLVAKPLVESHRVAELLGALGTAKGIWIYRHYQDVVSSNVVRWGTENGQTDLQPFLQESSSDWRSAGSTAETRSILAALVPDATDNDAAALFWWARNRLFFDQELAAEPRLRLIRYENLVQNPAAEMSKVYAHAGMTYPGDDVVALIGTQSVGKGHKVVLSEAVETLCESLLAELEAAAG